MSMNEEDRERFEAMKAKMVKNLPKDLPTLMKDLPSKIARQHGIAPLPIEEAIIATLSWFLGKLSTQSKDNAMQFLDTIAEDLAKEAVGIMMKDIKRNTTSANIANDILNKFKKE